MGEPGRYDDDLCCLVTRILPEVWSVRGKARSITLTQHKGFGTEGQDDLTLISECKFLSCMTGCLGATAPTRLNRYHNRVQ